MISLMTKSPGVRLGLPPEPPLEADEVAVDEFEEVDAVVPDDALLLALVDEAEFVEPAAEGLPPAPPWPDELVALEASSSTASFVSGLVAQAHPMPVSSTAKIQGLTGRFTRSL
jgi:hypothetical protein